MANMLYYQPMNIGNKKIIFLDTETTGNEGKDYLCQLAYKTGDEVFSELFKPPLPIAIEASAVCHITNKMVADKPAFRESVQYAPVKKLLETNTSILVAHNAKFDVGMLAKEGIVPTQVICTMRIARYLDTENVIPKYNLQYLRYYLGMEIEATAHDALGDVLILEELFKRLFTKMREAYDSDEATLTAMIEVSARPSFIPIFTFGKYIGQKVSNVAKTDIGYLEWMYSEKKKSDRDEEDWLYTLEQYLKK